MLTVWVSALWTPGLKRKNDKPSFVGDVWWFFCLLFLKNFLYECRCFHMQIKVLKRILKDRKRRSENFRSMNFYFGMSHLKNIKLLRVSKQFSSMY